MRSHAEKLMIKVEPLRLLLLLQYRNFECLYFHSRIFLKSHKLIKNCDFITKIKENNKVIFL